MKKIISFTLFIMSLFVFSSISVAGDFTGLERIKIPSVELLINFNTPLLKLDTLKSFTDDHKIGILSNHKFEITVIQIKAPNTIGEPNRIPLIKYTYFLQEVLKV